MFQGILDKDADPVFLLDPFILFRTADTVKTASGSNCIFIQELIDLDRFRDLIQERAVIRQLHNHTVFLGGEHAQGRIRIFIAVWSEDGDSDVIGLIALEIPVIHFLVKWEQVAVAVTVFFIRENFLENHRRCLSDNLSHFYRLIVDRIVDLLLLISQEYINFSVFLYQSLPDQFL